MKKSQIFLSKISFITQIHRGWWSIDNFLHSLLIYKKKTRNLKNMTRLSDLNVELI